MSNKKLYFKAFVGRFPWDLLRKIMALTPKDGKQITRFNLVKYAMEL